MSPADSTAAIEAVYRVEFPRVVAALAGFTGDLALAEEVTQDALVDALRQWPRDGTPRNPGAWLTTVAKRKAIDVFRRDRLSVSKYAEVGRDLEITSPFDANDPAVHVDSDDEIDDDRLRLIFVACHPVLAMTARVALTLRLVGGLTVAEIARAYVVPEATIAQRIVRAKKSIAEAGVPFEVPSGEDRLSRLGAVLEVIYLIFNEGYSATAGADWVRPDLCAEALRLGRALSALMPAEPEVCGLVALMELHASRLRARTGPTGAPILLLDQDRRLWDRLHIARGEAALGRADDLAAHRGPYALQAAIAACHARAFRPEETDWKQIAALYTELARRTPSPVVELNRAVAVSRASGPAEALALVDLLVATGTLERYHWLYSVRGDLLDQLGRGEEAAVEFERAARLGRQRPGACAAERTRSDQPPPRAGDTRRRMTASATPEGTGITAARALLCCGALRRPRPGWRRASRSARDRRA